MKKLLQITILLCALVGLANDVQVDKVLFNKETGIVNCTVSWENSWRNDKNYDAAWVFIKLVTPDGDYVHGKLAESGHDTSEVLGPKANLSLPEDRIGVFIEPGMAFRGNVTWKLDLKIDAGMLADLPENVVAKVFAIEMVYIPKGSFYIGDIDQEAVDYASFYQSGADGQPTGPYKINSEDQVISVSRNEGDLFYRTGNSPYRGDRKGTVPATFPKGHAAFYMMKYETTQGLYTDFLNSLSPELAATLSPHQTEKYYEKRGSIGFKNGDYVAKSRNRPANYITWDDGAALADWAGLRPMTELEYTKASRGTEKPMTHEFPWGTNNVNGLKREVTLNDELSLIDGVNEGDLNEQNRNVYGASFYWVMDLAGSLWEKCVTIGDDIGRNYRGTHGDGVISSQGTATNADWPKGIAEEGGYGYRGGGYYSHGMKVSDYNPHSPISYRPYGSWAGGKRSIAYSQRYVRTAVE